MSTWQASPFSTLYRDSWDALVASSPQGAMQHTRHFLDYHGRRFVDASLMFKRNDEVKAVFPAGQVPGKPNEVVSHPGSAYGGLVTGNAVRSSSIPDLVDAMVRHYAGDGVKRLGVRPPWPWTQKRPNDTLCHEMLRRGAIARPWQLISVLDTNEEPQLTARRRRMIRRAHSSLAVSWDLTHLAEFWTLLESRLLVSHQARPTHSIVEIRDLARRFPQNLRLATAWKSDQMTGGVVVLYENVYHHLQYIAASDEGRSAGAVDLLVTESFTRAMRMGARYLSLGSSVNPEDHEVNRGLLDFKEEFGAHQIAVPYYELHLG